VDDRRFDLRNYGRVRHFALIAMPNYKVAHIHQQGQDMIIFPLESKFGQMIGSEQDRELGILGSRANQAGLRGVAVAVWDAGGGQAAFRGPPQCCALLSRINFNFVMANLNRVISWR
jgi:hypothetical protein